MSTGTGIQISKRLILINSASTAASRVVQLAVIVWMYQYLLRRISAEEYALLPVVNSVLVFFPLISTVFTSGLSRYVLEAYAKGNAWEVTRISSTMFPLVSALGLLVLACGGLFGFYIERILVIPPDRVSEARLMFLLLVGAFTLRLATTPFGMGFHVRQRFFLLNGINLGSEMLRIAILFFLLLGLGPRVLWVVVAATVSQCCLVAVTTIVSLRLVPELRFAPAAIHWPITGRITSFGGWMFLGQLADMLRKSADPLILNRLATAVDVVTFQLGSVAEAQIRTLAPMVMVPLLPQMSAMAALEHTERLARTYLRGGRYALWLGLGVACPMAVFSRELYVLYAGAAYQGAAQVLILLTAAYPLAYGHVVASQMAFVKGAIRSWTLRILVAQLVGLGITLYLVWGCQLGAVGSALGTFLTTLIFWPLLVWPFGLRLASLSFGEWWRATFFPGLFPAALTLAALGLLKQYIAPTSWSGLGFCAGFGWLLYAVLVIWLALQPEDRQDLRKAVEKLKTWKSALIRSRNTPT